MLAPEADMILAFRHHHENMPTKVDLEWIRSHQHDEQPA